MNSKFSSKSANMFLFIVVIVYFGLNYLTGYLANYIGEDFYNNNFYYLILFNQIAGILIPVIIYSIIKKIPYQKSFRFERIKIRHIIMIVIMAPLVMLLAASINGIWNYILGFDIADIQNGIPIPKDNNELLLTLLVIGLTPAICEEFLCRGVILNGYERHGSMKAIIISGLLFSILHFDIRVLGSIFFMGVIIGYYVVRTNSIYAGILAHFLNNSLASLQRYYFRDIISSTEVVMDRKTFESSIILGIIMLMIFIPILTLFWHLTKGTSKNSFILNNKNMSLTRSVLHWPIFLIIILYVLYQYVYVF